MSVAGFIGCLVIAWTAAAAIDKPTGVRLLFGGAALVFSGLSLALVFKFLNSDIEFADGSIIETTMFGETKPARSMHDIVEVTPRMGERGQWVIKFADRSRVILDQRMTNFDRAAAVLGLKRPD